MIFLFEEHPYDSDFLKTTIGYDQGDLKYRSKSGFNTQKKGAGISINGVGYCFYNGQPIFVLPKVFLYKDKAGSAEKAFGIEIDGAEGKSFFCDVENDSILTIQRRFLSSLSLWLYAAIDKYNRLGGKDNGVDTPPRSESQNFRKSERYATLLDIVSSMELFYKKNQSLFVFVAKNKHSGNHKINWQKTVNKKTPFIQDGVPIYMDTVNKVKVFDLDDRLLVLYFSAMKYIQDKYGYIMPQSEFYQPLKMDEMERLMENERGLRELRKIRYKYFEDRLLKLYNIMEAFFYWGACYKNKDNKSQEYLIANSFNNVFEAMIDELIGDPKFEDLKKNDDGKIIDHLYKEKSLIFANDDADEIWHIGDSKYYKDPKDIQGKAIYKQFTYAKNVMQNFFSPGYVDNESDDINKENNFYNDPKGEHYGVRYRDKLTEGYGVTPNFFIRGDIPVFSNDRQYIDEYFCLNDEQRKKMIAEVADDETFEDEEIKGPKNIKEHLWEKRNRHFKNRLFDRDTLLLQVYNVNFLYVLNAYTSKQSSIRENFKTKARGMFRRNFLNLLKEKYVFYKVWPKAEQAFVDKHFRTLVGKIYKPKSSDFLVLALEKGSARDKDVVEMLQKIKPDCEKIDRVPILETA